MTGSLQHPLPSGTKSAWISGDSRHRSCLRWAAVQCLAEEVHLIDEVVIEQPAGQGVRRTGGADRLRAPVGGQPLRPARAMGPRLSQSAADKIGVAAGWMA